MAWEEVVVPDGVTVVERRAKDGEGPSVTGIDSGEAIEGVRVALRPGAQNVEGELPVATATISLVR